MKTKHYLFIAGLTALLSACGGDSDDTPTSGTPDNTGTNPEMPVVTTPPDPTPKSTIYFPSALSLTYADNITVRGIATDSDGDITTLTVNGVEATSTDNFATWQANIPLTAGDNTITATVTDLAGNSDSSSVLVKAATINLDDRPSFFDIDRTARKGWGVVNGDSIMEFDLDTGESTLISRPDFGDGSPTRGTGITPDSLSEVAVDYDNKVLYVADNTKGAVIKVDLDSGNRSVFSGIDDSVSPAVTIGTGSAWASFSSIAFAINTLYGTNWSGQVVRMDSNGNREIIAHNGTLTPPVGTGNITPTDLRSVAVKADNSAIYVGDINPARIIKIDTSTLERTLVSGTSDDAAGSIKGSGDLTNCDLLNFSPDENTLYCGSRRNILTVDIATGDREKISGEKTGHYSMLDTRSVDHIDDRLIITAGGEPLQQLDLTVSGSHRTVLPYTPIGAGMRHTSKKIAVAPAAGMALLDGAVNGAPVVVSLDLNTGDRTVIFDSAIEPFNDIRNLAINPTADKAWLGDNTQQAFYELDLVTNTVQLLSGNGFGFGESFHLNLSSSTIYDPNLQKLLFGTDSNRLIYVDILTGYRDVLTCRNCGVGSGDAIRIPWGIYTEAAEDLTWVADTNRDAVQKVINASGERIDVSSIFIGTGDAITNPQDIVADSSLNKAFVTDVGDNTLRRVEISSGNRSTALTSPTLVGSLLSPIDNIAADAEAQVAWLTTGTSQAILLFDMVTEEHVFMSY